MRLAGRHPGALSRVVSRTTLPPCRASPRMALTPPRLDFQVQYGVAQDHGWTSQPVGIGTGPEPLESGIDVDDRITV